MVGKHKGKHRKRLFGDKGSLPGLASRALGWSFASNVIARLGTLPIGIVLARLLGPHAFGTYAVALVALVALLSFNDLSVSLAIVRWDGDPDEIAPTVATLSVAASLIIYAACYLIAPTFSWAMGAPAATEVVRVLALNVLVDGMAATPAAMLQRQFRQDRKMIADQVNNWLGAIVSIGLAWQGFGPMSLAIGRICGGGASVILFFMFAPVRFGFDPRKAKALLKFGLPLAGSSIVAFAVSNTDQLVVGHLLGATALGFYALALNLASWPLTMFSLPTRSVAPAVFSRLQQDKAAMRAGFLCVARLLSVITVPICFVLGGAAVPLVGLVYGARWLPAAAALAGLGVLSALRIGFELIYDFFVVLARSRVVLIVQLIWLVGLVPGLIGGTLADGISGAAIAEAGVAGCVVLPCYLFWLARVGIRPTDLLRRLWLSMLVGVAVAAVAAIAARRLSTDLAALGAAAAGTLAGIGFLATRMRPTLAELRRILQPDRVLHTPVPAPEPAQQHRATTITATAGSQP
ncbi:MAG TPA: lipopolysaccharide biosynthesis protein [Streptosporangiaceae bacterium]|nr:lipopolysaccharide biosynthesis protein [Streptosporangiaceae bacterium]